MLNLTHFIKIVCFVNSWDYNFAILYSIPIVLGDKDKLFWGAETVGKCWAKELALLGNSQ